MMRMRIGSTNAYFYLQESLYFLKEVSTWRANYYDMSPLTRTARAKKIVSSFIVSTGPFGVNLPSNEQEEIERVVRSSKDLPLTLFDRAFLEIKKLLQRGAMIRFLKRIDQNESLVGSEVKVSA